MSKKIPLGKIGFNYCGTYDSSKSYDRLDVVNDGNIEGNVKAYVAVTSVPANTSAASLSSKSYWSLFCSTGTTSSGIEIDSNNKDALLCTNSLGTLEYKTNLANQISKAGEYLRITNFQAMDNVRVGSDDIPASSFVVYGQSTFASTVVFRSQITLPTNGATFSSGRIHLTSATPITGYCVASGSASFSSNVSFSSVVNFNGITNFNNNTNFNAPVHINNSEDAITSSYHPPAFTVGASNGIHLEIDNDEIIAKSNSTTGRILNLNYDTNTAVVINGANSNQKVIIGGKKLNVSTTTSTSRGTAVSMTKDEYVATTSFVYNAIRGPVISVQGTVNLSDLKYENAIFHITGDTTFIVSHTNSTPFPIGTCMMFINYTGSNVIIKQSNDNGYKALLKLADSTNTVQHKMSTTKFGVCAITKYSGSTTTNDNWICFGNFDN